MNTSKGQHAPARTYLMKSPPPSISMPLPDPFYDCPLQFQRIFSWEQSRSDMSCKPHIEIVLFSQIAVQRKRIATLFGSLPTLLPITVFHSPFLFMSTSMVCCSSLLLFPNKLILLLSVFTDTAIDLTKKTFVPILFVPNYFPTACSRSAVPEDHRFKLLPPPLFSQIFPQWQKASFFPSHFYPSTEPLRTCTMHPLTKSGFFTNTA